jgi:hypothetical protein
MTTWARAPVNNAVTVVMMLVCILFVLINYARMSASRNALATLRIRFTTELDIGQKMVRTPLIKCMRF